MDLEEAIQSVIAEARRLIQADRCTLWLMDPDRGQIWTKIPLADSSSQELRLGIGQGFAGEVAASGKILNIPFDFYGVA